MAYNKGDRDGAPAKRRPIRRRKKFVLSVQTKSMISLITRIPIS